MILTGHALRERFQALDDFLVSHQSLWRPKPFTCPVLPWEAEHAELAAWLRRRSLAQADAEHNQPAELPAPAPFPALARRAAELSALGQLPSRELGPLPERLSVDVPGRK